MMNYIGGFRGETYPGVFGVGAGLLGAGIAFLIVVLMLWSLIWKGMALWKAARLGHEGWFVALLVINTAGILDILYLYVFSKKSKPSN